MRQPPTGDVQMGVGSGQCRCREDHSRNERLHSHTPTCVSRRTGGGVQVGVGNGRCRCREDRSPGRASRHRCRRHSHPCRPPCQSWSQKLPAPFAQSRRLRAKARTWGSLGYSLNVPACRFNPRSIANGDRRRCSQCCRRRTRLRSRPHCAGQVAHSQTSGHGRQAALSCIKVPGRCCRQSARGSAWSRPPCASRGAR